MVRKSHFRNTDPSLKPREARWAREAHSWAQDQARAVFEAHRGAYLTVGQVMSYLDTLPADQLPTGYVRYIGNYEPRYQIVRAECDKLAKAGQVESGTTVNSKGRDAVCYRMPPLAQFEIIMSGPRGDDPRIRAAFENLTRDYENIFAGLDEILISRVERKVPDHTVSGEVVNHEVESQISPTTKRGPGRPRKIRPYGQPT